MPVERDRTRRRMAGVAVPLAVVGAVVWVQAWHGPTLLTLSATHGLDTGDLVAVPFLLLAIAVARRRPIRTHSSGSAFPISVVTLGGLLMLSGQTLLTSKGGPMVPGG